MVQFSGVTSDISDKSNPIQVGDFYYIGSASSVAIIGNYAYVSDNTEGTQLGLQIFDVTYPHFPGIYEIITIPASQKVYAAGNVAYLMSDNLYLLDVSNPTNPIIASTLELPDLAILSGDRLYTYKLTDEFSYFPLGLFSELIVSDPYQPDQIGLYKYKMGAWGISKKDNYVYFASDIHGLHIIDISDPELPYWVSSVDLPGRAGSVAINGNYAYVASGPDGLYIVDISSPDFPSLEGIYDTAGSISDVNIIGDLAFLAAGSGGLIIINISNPANPTFVGQFNSNGTAGSLDVYGDYAYIADGDNGLNIINIANPSSPYFVKSFDTTYRAEDVLVSGSIVYLTENEGGESFQGWLRIIDVSNPSQPTQLGVVSGVQITDITKEENIIFGTDYFGYLRAYDVTNPSQPLEVGFSEPYPPLWGLVVDQFKIFAVGYDGMFVVDYTGGGGGDDLFEDVRQAGEIVISGNLVEGGTVYLTIPVKNFGTASSPPIHPYSEGYTSLSQLWRADGANPTAQTIDPGETINFTVQHDLWYGHVGQWTTDGVYLWNDQTDGYYGPLPANGYNQQLTFNVESAGAIDVFIEPEDVYLYQVVMSDDIPLVAGKPTIVRIFPEIEGIDSLAATATIRLFDDNQSVIDDIEIMKIKPSAYYISANHHHEIEGASINYSFISSEEIKFIEVEIDAEKDGNHSNNKTIKEVDFIQPQRTIDIKWIPFIHNNVEDDLKLKFFDDIYPGFVEFNELTPHQPIPMNNIYNQLTSWYYLNKLKIIWETEISLNSNHPDRLFGVVPHNAFINLLDLGGQADSNWSTKTCTRSGTGRVALGHGVNDTYAMTHEILHLLNIRGLFHPGDGNCEDNDYPNNVGNLDVPGIEFENGSWEILKTNEYFDFMTYEDPAWKWISEHNYRKILEEGFEDFESNNRLYVRENISNKTNNILVSGIVHNDTQSVEIDPIFPLGPLSQPDLNEGGNYCIEQWGLDNSSLDQNCFDISFFDYESGENSEVDGFVRKIALSTETNSLKISYLGTIISEITASENKPVVQLIKPNGGENWEKEGEFTLQWEARDQDSDELNFSLFFSPDNGANWSPIAVNISGESFDVDISSFQGAISALVKIVVSDGFHFSEDTSDAPFSVSNKPPEVEILSPANNANLHPDYGVILQGWASDSEDESILNENMIWSSNLDGALGTGDVLVVPKLSAGKHEITLSATDSNDNKSSKVINVFVGFPVYVPLVSR